MKSLSFFLVQIIIFMLIIIGAVRIVQHIDKHGIKPIAERLWYGEEYNSGKK